MNLALDDVRAAEARRMVQDGYEPVLKKSRWSVLKRPENLTDKQHVKLRDVLRYNLASVRALAEGDIPRLMGLRLAHLGGQVPGPVDKPGDALSHRADEEIRPHDSRSPRAIAELLSRLKGVPQRRNRGTEQQSESQYEKSLRLPNVCHDRNRALSCAWQITRT